MTNEQYTTKITPTWCPGCGNFGILAALIQALTQLELSPQQVAIVTDVGCSGNMADFVNTGVLHALHGRALPPAAGIKLANHDLKVIAIIGDGGCYGEGMTHLISLMRGNHDITAIIHNNGLYSLTTGQAAPTTPKGQITKSTPEGVIEEPINPLTLALSNQATFIARGYSMNVPHFTELLVQAIKHTGFSFIDALQPCVTFNKKLLAEQEKKIQVLTQKPQTKQEAWQLANQVDQLGIGIFWQEQRPAYHQEISTLKQQSLIKQPIDKIDIAELLKEFI